MKDRKTVLLIVVAGAMAFIGVIALIIIAINFLLPQPVSNSANSTQTNTSSKSSLCSTYGGTWLQAYNECESVDQEQCAAMSGSFNGCASACRHNPNAGACIQVCVRVCSL